MSPQQEPDFSHLFSTHHTGSVIPSGVDAVMKGFCECRTLFKMLSIFFFLCTERWTCFQQNIVVTSSKTVNVYMRCCATHNKSNIQHTGPIGFPTSASLFSVPICTSSNEFADLEITHWIWKYSHCYICYR